MLYLTMHLTQERLSPYQTAPMGGIETVILHMNKLLRGGCSSQMGWTSSLYAMEWMMSHTAYRQHPKYRESIFERDNYTCQLCGSTERLELDHIIPYAISQNSEANNLRAACVSCNRATRRQGKSRRALSQQEFDRWLRQELVKV